MTNPRRLPPPRTLAALLRCGLVRNVVRAALATPSTERDGRRARTNPTTPAEWLAQPGTPVPFFPVSPEDDSLLAQWVRAEGPFRGDTTTQEYDHE